MPVGFTKLQWASRLFPKPKVDVALESQAAVPVVGGVSSQAPLWVWYPRESVPRRLAPGLPVCGSVPQEISSAQGEGALWDWLLAEPTVCQAL